MVETEKALSIEEIKAKYPNEWVLLGDPVIEVTQVLSGIVIAHAKDKRELINVPAGWRQEFPRSTVVYTGEFPKNRKFLL